MKYPLWILNSALLVLLVFACGFIFFSQQKPAAPESIEPTGIARPLKGEAVKINISKIYENDLFGTYVKETPTFIPGALPAVPEPPQPNPVSVPPIPAPQFLEPLNITLKGIIVMINDDAENRAIIADNKTNQENTYRVGQTIEDAQLLSILSNKVIFLRFNGQQEVLYLREKDAQLDPAYLNISNWQDVAQKVTEAQYNVNPREFINRVNDLGQFIDMLDLITVYKNGRSVGCRVNKITPKSLGEQLGLRNGDIITSINNIPTTNTTQRFKIYKEVIATRQDGIITVQLLRDQRPLTFKYQLKDFKIPKLNEPSAQTGGTMQLQPSSTNAAHQEQLRSLQERHKFAPTLNDIRSRERENIMRTNKPMPDTTKHHSKSTENAV